jgi:hypothetical protein
MQRIFERRGLTRTSLRAQPPNELSQFEGFLRPGPMTIISVGRLQDSHGLLRTARQQGGILGARQQGGFLGANNLVSDNCLIGIHSHMLHRDLLLPTTSMLI